MGLLSAFFGGNQPKTPRCRDCQLRGNCPLTKYDDVEGCSYYWPEEEVPPRESTRHAFLQELENVDDNRKRGLW